MHVVVDIVHVVHPLPIFLCMYVCVCVHVCVYVCMQGISMFLHTY